MKRIILLITFCLSLSAIYAQTIDVIHLKNGFDARGTITNRTESQITLQFENGRTLTIDMSEIESMEQEQKAFDPRVLIGRWACYKANGDRDARFDIEINENEGFYTVTYIKIIDYYTKDGFLKSYPDDAPTSTLKKNVDIDVKEGMVSYYFWQGEGCTMYGDNERKQISHVLQYSCDIDLKYDNGKLKGSIDCLGYYEATGCRGYGSPQESLEHGCGTVWADGGPCGKWRVYFVKY